MTGEKSSDPRAQGKEDEVLTRKKYWNMPTSNSESPVNCTTPSNDVNQTSIKQCFVSLKRLCEDDICRHTAGFKRSTFTRSKYSTSNPKEHPKDSSVRSSKLNKDLIKPCAVYISPIKWDAVNYLNRVIPPTN